MAVDTLQRLKARREAPYHVQVEITAAPPPAGDGLARVEGRVSRVFRSDGRPAVGDPVTLRLAVVREQEDPPPGRAAIVYERLIRATHLEAFLLGDPPRCEVCLDELELLSEALPGPILSAERLEPG
jgi:hypothetical protein